MKLWSQFRPAVFWVEPSFYSPADHTGRREKTEGLKIEFTTLGGPGAGSVWDSEAEQQRRGWSDERRIEVEEYLKGQNEWGMSLFLADDSVQVGRVSGAACQVMTIIQGGVRSCGRPVAEVGQVCELHGGPAPGSEELEDQEAPEVPPVPTGVL